MCFVGQLRFVWVSNLNKPSISNATAALRLSSGSLVLKNVLCNLAVAHNY